ncbi:hypothetical protein [Streptomyces sp. NPDC059171]|uniref:LIC_13387 family protein n=1 Tax=Streptomyces sp. NPDC059171 TaxID=3346755 RepID=UPI0036B2F48B
MTTATSTARTSPGADPVRPFKAGAYGFVVLGAGHLALSAAAASGTPTPEQRAADTAMRESAFTLLGLERTTFDVTHGMSIAMALFAIVCGLLLLTAVRHAPDLVRRRTAFGRVPLVASLARPRDGAPAAARPADRGPHRHQLRFRPVTAERNRGLTYGRPRLPRHRPGGLCGESDTRASCARRDGRRALNRPWA